MELKRGKDVWNESEGGVVRSKKQTEWETVDHWHARGGGLLSNDWLEDKKQDLITCGTCVTPWWCHAHEMIVYNKILLESSLDYSQNDLGSNDILMKKNQRLSLNKWSKLDHPW